MGFECYVVFPPPHTDKMNWWNAFTSEGFTHCIVLEEFDWSPQSLLESRWLIETQFNRGFIITNYYPVSVERYVALTREITPGVKVVRFDCRVAIDSKMQYIPLRLLNCVEYVKAKLGIQQWFVWTPKQLYRCLLANEGYEI